MSRAALIALALGAFGIIAVVVLGLTGDAVMPSCLGGWLAILALPLGALPVVMGAELLGRPETHLLLVLRRLVALMPLAALPVIPVLLRHDLLYPSLGLAKDGLPGWWMTPGFFAARAILFLVAWTALSFVFSREPGRGDRRRLVVAGFGLALHFVMATLAADDWVQQVEPGLNSSALGLLLIAAQSSIAACLAVVLVGTGRLEPEASHALSSDRQDVAATRQVAIGLAILLGAWGFLTFTQYLVVWSANLPREVIWYQHRAAGLGLAAEVSAGILCALALVALLAHSLSRHAAILAWVAAALLVMHGLEMFWLVTPSFRAGFGLTPADVAAFAGAAGLGIGAALILGERARRGRLRHGA